MANWRIVGNGPTFTESWTTEGANIMWVHENRIKLMHGDGTISILQGSGFDSNDLGLGTVTSIQHYAQSTVAPWMIGALIDRATVMLGEMRLIDLSAGYGLEQYWLGYDDDIRNLNTDPGSQTNHLFNTSWGDDVVHSGGGNDGVNGMWGNDQLFGQNGDDILDGGHWELSETDTGDDLLYGGAGNDTLHGRDGTDKLFGGEGADKLYGGDGNDSLNGGSGEDNIYAGAGDDRIVGGSDSDGLYYLEHFDNLTIEARGTGSAITSAGSGTDYVTGVEVLLTLDGAYFWSDSMHSWVKSAGPDAVVEHFSDMFPDIFFSVTDEVLLMS